MSHFYGLINNHVNKIATRRGFKSHGITSVVNSWKHTCKVYLHEEDGKDVFSILITEYGSGKTLKAFEFKED